MTPQTRRWTKIGSGSVGAVIGAGLTLLPMAARDPDYWFSWIERVGLPVACLVALAFMMVVGTSTVWNYCTPKIDDLVGDARLVFKKQSAFVDKCDQTQDEMKAMLRDGQGRDTSMGEVLDRIDRRTEDTYSKVKEIHSRIGR